MAGTVRLVQISDCHIPSGPDPVYRGQRPVPALESLLPAIAEFDPHALLLTGDVSEDGGAVSYRRVREILSALEIPVLVLPGNHDDPAELRRHFPDGPWNGPCLKRMGQWLIVLLDSTIPGGIGGAFSEAEMRLLARVLEGNDASRLLFALHHQPMPVGSPWIDRYALESGEQFRRFVASDPRSCCVVWGHIHQVFEKKTDGVLWLGSPSSAVNSEPGCEKFTPDPAGPGCRWLVLKPDGPVKTGILRARGGPQISTISKSSLPAPQSGHTQ